ncbi:MAG: endonuclease MutS2, partial [Ruminococcaceae bacterium]|nr:endonuclease MutS2 [Oscillospiraceae bacterium]
MSKLYDKSLVTLELPKVLDLLASCATCDEAKEKALALRPMTDVEEIRYKLQEVSAACKLISYKTSPNFQTVKDVSGSLKRADMGGSLNTRELLAIADVLRTARIVKTYADGQIKTCIDHLFDSLRANKFLEERITNSIIGDDELADSASTELADIRRHMKVANSKARDALNKIITSPAYSKYLRDPIITLRGDRYVVPVRSEYKNEIPGLVHDVSSSGGTFFVEPMQVVNANNELRELLAKEKKEIERILAELSAMAAEHMEDILEDYSTLVYLDLIFAKAKLSYNLKCIEPIVEDTRSLELRHARHPLINIKNAVPIDVRLGKDFDTLVVTGPNTGGKTVTLKTIGLLTLMAECG